MSLGMLSEGVAQESTASRSISDDQVHPDAQFVIGWLNYAAASVERGNTDEAARGLVEALRGLSLIHI